jgi:DNA-binding NarL/FixJ family response regulator
VNPVDGDEAIRKADALKLVLDQRLPIANGTEVAAQLDVSMPKTPIVIFTMFDERLLANLSPGFWAPASVVSKSKGRDRCAVASKRCSKRRMLSLSRELILSVSEKNRHSAK